MEEELRALMIADSGISAIVSNRVTWGEREEEASFPSINMTVISKPGVYHMRGASSYNEYRIQINCAAITYGGAKVLSRAVEALLSGYSGGTFQGVFLEGERDLRYVGSNDANKLFAVTQDYLVHHS